MVKLSRAISTVIIDEYGVDELLARMTDSNWFQALSCAIGYDWHSSGTTTVTMGALKEAMNESGEIFIAGGKGKAGLKTPQEIISGTDSLSIPGMDKSFTEYSRLSAKVDGGMVYENLGIYHHTFVFTKNRKWGVIQQGMSSTSNKAIRFQWNSDLIDQSDITNEPHAAVNSELRKMTVDLTYRENQWAKRASVELLSDYPRIAKAFEYPSRHWIHPQVDIGKKGIELIRMASDLNPSDYRELLLIKDVGRSTLRSLAFVSSLIFEKELAQRDPVAYAYNLGGKDKIPFEINRKTYDSVIDSMNEIIDRARMEKEEKYKALKRLSAAVTSSAIIQ
jgi:hypothetical protein